MSLRDDWKDISMILTRSRDAVRGDLDEEELVEYTSSLNTITKYAALTGAVGGALVGEEAGLYSNEDLNEASGLDGWEEPSDFGSIWPIATAGFSGALSGGITTYGTYKLAKYVDDQHGKDE